MDSNDCSIRLTPCASSWSSPRWISPGRRRASSAGCVGVQILTNRETPGHWAKGPQPDLVFLQALQDRARHQLGQFVTGIRGGRRRSPTHVIVIARRGRTCPRQVHGSPLDRLCLSSRARVGDGRRRETLGVSGARVRPGFLKVTKKRFCSQRCQSRIYMRQLRRRRTR